MKAERVCVQSKPCVGEDAGGDDPAGRPSCSEEQEHDEEDVCRGEG